DIRRRALLEESLLVAHQPSWRSRRWCRNCSAWASRDLQPCGSRALGARPERSDNRSQAVVVHLASAAVRHIRRGTTHGTRTDCRFEEVSVPARRVLSSECWRLRISNVKAAAPIAANKHRVVSLLIVSIARCSSNNRQGAG